MATYNGSIGANTDDGTVIAGSHWYEDYVIVGLDGGSFDGYDFYLRFTNVTIPAGSTITSAVVTLTSGETDSGTNKATISCIDEDDTATFSSDPSGRSKTTAGTLWNVPSRTLNSTYATSDFKTSVQEVIDRVGWTSGNDLGVAVTDNFYSTVIAQFYDYNDDTNKVATIAINYTTTSPSSSASKSASPSGSLSPSASASASASKSLSPSSSKSGSFSPSASISPSASTSASSSASESVSQSPSLSPSASTSASASASYSPSPSPIQPFYGLKIAKDGVDALATQEPYNFKFNSDYGTLKYLSKETAHLEIDAFGGGIASSVTIDHDLGYYPFVEVFVDHYIGSSTGTYQYCPFAGAGASVFYSATYKVTTSQIVFYAWIDGMSSSTWEFDFIVFIYKNNLNLS